MVAVTRSHLLHLRRRALLQPEWDGILPPGRKRGLKTDRRSRIMDRCESISTVQELIDEKHWDALSKDDSHLEKRLWYRCIYDQNGIGSCAAESAAAGKGALDAGQNLRLIIYNPWGPYKITSGGRDQGSNIGDNVEFLRDKGFPPEELHPRSLGWRASMSAEAVRVSKLFCILEFFYIENIQQLVSALLQGFCVHGGYSGHAVDFVQWLGNGKLLFCNSWHESWGDHGFGVLPVDKVYFSYGAYAYKNALHYTDQDWKPKYNQETLALVVNDFMRKMSTVHQPWSDRYRNFRLDAYSESLQARGIAA